MVSDVSHVISANQLFIKKSFKFEVLLKKINHTGAIPAFYFTSVHSFATGWLGNTKADWL